MENGKSARSCRRGGFTLIEATAATVILAVAASGILMSFAAAASVQTEAQRQVIASRLAADLIEEIAATNYSQIISTYHGYNEAAGSMKDRTGATITGAAYRGLSRSAVCQTATAAGVNLIWVTVEVQYCGASVTKVSTLIGDKYRN